MADRSDELALSATGASEPIHRRTTRDSFPRAQLARLASQQLGGKGEIADSMRNRGGRSGIERVWTSWSDFPSPGVAHAKGCSPP